MEEQEYTFAQCAGQLSAVLNTHRALIAMHKMMQKAAQVESYLAEHEATTARIEDALGIQRRALIEVTEAHDALQESLKYEAKQHAQAKRAQTINAKEHVAECHSRIEAAEHHAAHECERIHQVLAEHCADAEAEKEIATAQLELIYEKLEEADRKFAALKESL